MIFRNIFENIILKFWKLILFLILVLVIISSYQIKNLTIDASSETLILEDDKDLAFTRLINKRYYSPDFLVIAYTPKASLFDAKTISNIREISNELIKLDRVYSVNSILNVPLLLSPPKAMSELIESVPTLEKSNNINLDLARKEFTTSPLYKDNLVSSDFKSTSILVNLKDDSHGIFLREKRSELKLLLQNLKDASLSLELKNIEAEYKVHRDKMRNINEQTIKDIRSILSPFQKEESLFLGGLAMISSDVVNFVEKDLKIFGISILFFIIFALIIIFRQLRWVILPILTCVISVLATAGLLGFFGWEITVISSNFISLQLIFTLAIVVHLIVRYRELTRVYPQKPQKFLLIETTHMMIKPCLFTALTTIAGFSSLVFSGILPVINFGWMMSVGLMISLLMAFLLFPILLINFKRLEPNLTFENLLPLPAFFSNLTEKVGRKIILIALIIFILGLGGIYKLEVENSFIDYFKDNSEIYKGMKLIDTQLGGTTSLDVIIDFDEKNDEENMEFEEDEMFVDDEFSFLDEETDEKNYKYWFTSERMNIIESVHDFLLEKEEIGNVTSFATILKVGKKINNNRDLDIIQLALLYEELPEEYKKLIINPYISIEYNQARIVARIKDSLPDLRRANLLKDLKKNIPAQIGIESDRVRFGSVLVLYNNMLQSLFKSQILTLGTVITLLLIMFLILFRSLLISIIALFPNVLSISFVLGFMGWLSIPLDMMTITIAAISMGIAVDNTIHYIYRFKTEITKDYDYVESMKRSHKSIGYAMYYTSLTIIVGFSILMFSNFIPSIYFGLLTGLAMLMALLASLTLLPQLIMYFKPFGKQ